MSTAVESQGAPLCATLAEACERWSDRPAITAGGVTWTYAELWEGIQSLAAAYERLGIGRGDRVLCQLRNCAEHMAVIGATWMRGAIQVGADNDLTGSELTRLAQRFEAKALVFQPRADAEDPLAPARAVQAECPDTAIIVHEGSGAAGAAGTAPADDGHSGAVEAGGATEPATEPQAPPATEPQTPPATEPQAPPATEPQAPPATRAFHSLSALMSEGGTVPPDLPGPLDTAVLFLTSGTTGEPKAIIESRSAHWAKMQLFADGFLPGTDDVHLLYLPISHVFGFRLALLALLRGGRLVLLERFSPARALQVVGEEGVTVLPAVPAHLRLLRERYDPARHDVSSLRWVLAAAARLPRELAEWVYEVLEARIMYVYGCSEGFTTITNRAEDVLAGSVGSNVFIGPPGTPAAGTVRVIDPDSGEALATGETGEITYGSRMPVDYWDHPSVAVDGWYRTGDLGHVDEAGRVYVTGRIKELINRGGLHVSITEVETALQRDPRMKDAAVIAVPDEVMGEAVCACIVPAPGAAVPSLGELRDSLSEQLARHKLPDELCVLDSIPRTDIGKVDRRPLSAYVLGGEVPRERLRG